MDIAKSIRVAMAKQNMPQHELAARLGITSQSISGFKARPDIHASTIRKLADAFGMKASAFVALGED
jgi:DNA-binding Xre family transcriptional regulator